MEEFLSNIPNMEEFLSNIPNTTEVIGVLIIGIVLLAVSFVRKLDKLAVVTLIGMIIYAGYLYFTNEQTQEESKEVIENLVFYVKDEIKKGTRINQIMRHTLGLFHGQTGSSFWKKYLSDNMCVRNADVQKIDHIMDKVKLAPQAHTVGQID